jgi:endonuclease/exonuclease/phosphatase family metal-dependent hydrolase
MKILFLNTWGGKTQHVLARFIQEQIKDTDIFCFQEAHTAVKFLCKDILSGYNEISDHKTTINKQIFFQTTYVRKEISLLSSQALLQEYPDCGLALYTHIRYKDTDVHLCNIHGIPKPGDKLDNAGRLKQSSELIDFFNDKRGIKIIGGDFNLLPNTRSVRLFEENGYHNLIEDYSIDTTRNQLSWQNYPNKQYYADYVFINQETNVTQFVVPKNEISDHLPLILHIEV